MPEPYDSGVVSEAILPQQSQQQQMDTGTGGMNSNSKKREVISSACTACQKRKSKCDGQRPTCSQCERKSTECSFEPNDLRRVTNLRSHNHQLSEKVIAYEALIKDLCGLDTSAAVKALQKLSEAIEGDNDIDPTMYLEAVRNAGAGSTSLWGGSSSSDESRLKGQQKTSVMVGNSTQRDPLSMASGGQHLGGLMPQLPSSLIQSTIASRMELASRSSWHPALQIREHAEVSLFEGEASASAGEINARKFVKNVSSSNLFSNALRFSGLDSGPQRRPPNDDGPQAPCLEIYGSMPTSTPYVNNGFPMMVESREHLDYRIPIHLVQSVVEKENSFLSRAYTDFRDATRRLISIGTPATSIIGPSDLVDVTLFFRPSDPSDPFSPHSWACEVSKSLSDFDNVIRLAMVTLLTYLMRWIIDPTPPSYEAVPELMRPTPAQRVIPHAAALDIIPNPYFRDAQIINFRDWVTSMARTTRFLWPGTLEDCVVADQESGAVRVTHEFEKAARDARNWSWAAEILETYPELEGHINIWRDAQ